MNVTHPTVGSVYPVAYNNSLLNFTFLYPTNYRFDKLYVRFTIYDFIGDNALNPQPYAFSWTNFTNSNFSLPWVVPPQVLQPGDYIIACFEWVQNNSTDQLVLDTYQCVLTRAAVNFTILSIPNPTTSTAVVTNTTATITAYYPTQLPYDIVNISSNLNGTILPSMMSSMTNFTGNSTYSTINMFSFMNLTSNTYYNICVYFNYANSLINGTQTMNNQCQIIMTLAGGSPSLSTSSISPTLTTSFSSSNKVLSNLTVIILLFIFAFM